MASNAARIRPRVVSPSIAEVGPTAPADLDRTPIWLAPLSVVAYLGSLAILATRATRAVFRSDGHALSFREMTARQAERLMGLGLGIVALVHVGMGSFLAMQAYFGATFVEGIGAVVGVGLVRNLAPMMSGFVVAGLIAACDVADFRGIEIDHAPPPGSPDDSNQAEDASIDRRVASRVAAAMIAGPVMAAWGSLVGTAVGWLVGRSMMGVSDPVFFDMFLEMIWARDVVGLVVKGAAFGGLAAILACHEGVRRRPCWLASPPDRRRETTCRDACRASLLAFVAIMVFNSGWFLVVYHAGPAFGPTLLIRPGG